MTNADDENEDNTTISTRSMFGAGLSSVSCLPPPLMLRLRDSLETLQVTDDNDLGDARNIEPVIAAAGGNHTLRNVQELDQSRREWAHRYC